MKEEEIGNLNNSELFEQIKAKCLSKPRIDFYSGLIILILIIAFMAYIGVTAYPYSVNDVIFLVFYAVMACIGVWLVLYSYRLKMRINSLDTPDQLLYWYKKSIRVDRMFSLVCGLALIISQICHAYLGEGGNIDYKSFFTLIVLTVAFVLLFNYLYMNSGIVKDKEMDIIDRLEDLIEQK